MPSNLHMKYHEFCLQMQSVIHFYFLVFLRLISDMHQLGDLDSSFYDIEATLEIVVAGSVRLAKCLVGCY